MPATVRMRLINVLRKSMLVAHTPLLPPGMEKKCEKEIQHLLLRHLDESPSATLSKRLGAIPVSGWEELSTLDVCIQETQRVTMTQSLIRRNMHEEIKVEGQVVRQGDYVVYPVHDFHVNPEYYPEPHKNDPGR